MPPDTCAAWYRECRAGTFREWHEHRAGRDAEGRAIPRPDLSVRRNSRRPALLMRQLDTRRGAQAARQRSGQLAQDGTCRLHIRWRAWRSNRARTEHPRFARATSLQARGDNPPRRRRSPSLQTSLQRTDYRLAIRAATRRHTAERGRDADRRRPDDTHRQSTDRPPVWRTRYRAAREHRRARAREQNHEMRARARAAWSRRESDRRNRVPVAPTSFDRNARAWRACALMDKRTAVPLRPRARRRRARQTRHSPS